MSDDLNDDFSWLSDDDESDSPDEDLFADLSDSDWQDSDSDKSDSGVDDSRLGFTGDLDWRKASGESEEDEDDGDLLADLSKLRGQKAPEPDLFADEPDEAPADDELMDDMPDWMRDVSESDEYERPTVALHYEGEVSDEIYERYQEPSDEPTTDDTGDDDDEFDDEVPDWILQGSMPAGTEPETDDAPAGDTPDWLQGATPAADSYEDAPGWMRDEESDADALFIDKDGDGIPDWMQADDAADSNVIPDDESVSDWMAAEPEAEPDQAETALPDWMDEVGTAAGDAAPQMDWLPDAPVFDSLEDTGRVIDDESALAWGDVVESPASIQQTLADDEEDDDIPDWMREEAPGFEPEMESGAGTSDDEEEVSPDWLAAGMAAYSIEPAADFDEGFTEDEDEDEVPDWIAQGTAPELVEESSPDFDNLFGSEDFDVEEEEDEFDLLSAVGRGTDDLDDLLGSAADDDFDLLGQLTGGGTDEPIGGDDDPLAAMLAGDDDEASSGGDDFFADLAAGMDGQPREESSEEAEEFDAFFDELDETAVPALPDDDLLLAPISDADSFEPEDDFAALFDNDEPEEEEPAREADFAEDELEAPPSAEAIEEAFTQFESAADDDELDALFGEPDDELAVETQGASSIFDDEDEGELNTFFTDYDDHDDQYEDWFGSIPQPEDETVPEETDWLQEIEEIDEETLAEELAAIDEARADASPDEVDDELGWLEELPEAELPRPTIDLDASGLDLEGDDDALGWLDDNADRAEPPADADEMMESLATVDDDLMAGITSAVDSGQHKLDRLLDKLSKDDTLELPVTGQLPTIDKFRSDMEFNSLMEDTDLAAMMDESGPGGITLAPDAPDWLVDLSQEAAGATSAAAVVRRRKERPLEELPDHLLDLRERALNLAAPGVQDLSGTALGSVLPGVNKTLVPQVIEPAVVTSLVTALPLSDEQEGRAKILQQVISAGTLLTDRAPEERSRWAGRIRAQTVIALLMVIAMLLPFVIDTLEVGSLPPSAFAGGSRQDVFVRQIHRLEPGQLALITVEYGPTGAAELDDATESLLLHTLQRGAIPVIVGSNPVGMLRVRSMLEEIAAANSEQIRINRDYVMGRFIVGDAIGLRDLNENIDLLVSDDLDGVDTGLTVKSLDEFSVIVVIAENAERVRLWGEQVKPETNTPILAITGQAAAPLSLPYVEANPERIGGMLIGYQDAFTYRTMILDLLVGQIDIDDITPAEITEEPEAIVTDEVIVPSETPSPEAQAAVTFPAPDDLSVIVNSGETVVSVFGQPDDSTEAVAALEPGDEALVLGTNADSSWYSILLVQGATEGWVRADQVSTTGIGVESLATETPQPSETPVPSNTPPPTATPAASPTSTPQPTATNTAPPSATPTVTPSPTLTLTPTTVATEVVIDVAIVTSSTAVNVRSGPGTGFSPVAVARPGEQALVLGANDDSSWYNILLESGIEGWIAASLVRIEQYTATPEPSESADLIEVGIVISSDVVNVRSGPGTGFGAVATLRPGDQVIIIGRTEGDTWYNVQLQNGVEGWIAAFLLRIELVTPEEGASNDFRMDQATVQKQSANLKRLPARSQSDDEPTPTQEGDARESEGAQTPESLPTIAPTLTPAGLGADLGGPDGGRALLVPVDDSDDYRDERWYSMNIGIIAAVLIIVIGNMLSIIRALLHRRRERS